MAAFKMSNESGFTLVEVLVTLVVLAVGLLGLSALLSTGMRFGTSAVYRSQATNLAYFIIDCMQANRAAALAGAYDDSGMPTAVSCPQTVSALATASIAAQDRDLWRKALGCGLPQGTGEITRNGTTFTVTVQWDDSRGEQPVQQFTTVTGL
ncbi:type IV pilus modification protein PilV [uncultured Thiodictyon sp.]|uniref:type IV pilus modification protein PilV n=1 Tax=uncultured Thiodictyon sp. TaxID=1846217 RepID=UPI0025FD45C3|nr:type IV pilus modification protein PilV [uncultured Thiodictyon sp.]